MRIDAKGYFDAARERAETSRRLFSAKDYVAAIYLAGVAAESMLRAYRVRFEPAFDARHDLLELARTSNLDVPDRLKPQLGEALGHVWARWKNGYRYVSAARLTNDLRKRKLAPKRGDILEHNARIAVSAALTIVALGVTQWTSRPR